MNIEKFSDLKLSVEIQSALNKLNYIKPTEVQLEVIPKIFAREDLIVQSETGSGKTAAYGIPICEIIKWEENNPQALILTPTRELAVQVKEDMINIGRLKRIKAAAVYGKQPVAIQKQELKQKNHIIVGTPGRVLDHIERGNLTLDQIQFLVIDEADEMLNMGFLDQVENIISNLPSDRVSLLFSATLPDQVVELAKRYLKDPININIIPKEETKNQIDHYYYEVIEDEKWDLLRKVTVVENPDSCIIFCRTKDRVDELEELLFNHGYNCDKIHGGMKQEDRLSVMNDFRQGKIHYLVATDVAARGIDIEKISLVIHYDLPVEVESYVHRSGRTGRAGEKGKSIAFVTEFEERILEEIEATIKRNIIKSETPTVEEVRLKKQAFAEKMNSVPILKEAKSEKLNQGIMKLYFNGGKKKKLRAVDFVGTIVNIDGVNVEDIGIINIMDQYTYVDILNGKGPIVLKAMKNKTIKGKKLKVHEARK